MVPTSPSPDAGAARSPTLAKAPPAHGAAGEAGTDVADDAAEAGGADAVPGADPATRRWPQAAPPDGIPRSRMLFIGVICFAVWLLLDAPSLQRSAVTSPLGTRRTVSLDVVGPIAALSRGLGLSHLVSWADEALGRTPGGGPALAKRLHPALPLAGVGHTAHGPRPTGPPGTPTSTIPALDQHPTAANPLRVLVMGDSIGIDLGQPLVADLSATGVATATLDGRIDTGLSRPDYFNWPAELGVDLANDRPRLVVVMMGANDPQSLVGANGEGTTAYGAPGWSAGYGQRVSGLIGEANAAGAHVLWVGMPPMARSDLNAGMQVLNSVVEAQVGTDPAGATFLASSAVLGDAQGNYTAYLPNSSGAEVNIRTPDGTHLSPDGGERLSQAVLTAMRSQLHIDLPG
ncbi:MAG TPA: DUF459 domain-containing protein [Acidimicrobiales bacterium]|nr:DUF459 domain-containing protein [Acidimicrobiales bacterium]